MSADGCRHHMLMTRHGPAVLHAAAGDVQTAALVGCFINGDSIPDASAERVLEWIRAYRDLLNVWQLWHKRAHFDVGRAQLHGRRTKSKVPPFARGFTPSRASHPSMSVASRFSRSMGRPGHGDAASMASMAVSDDNTTVDGDVRCVVARRCPARARLPDVSACSCVCVC